MNIVTLSGRLTSDPVVITTNKDSKVTKYTLAVQRSRHSADGKQPTADFVSCTAFGRVADFAAAYLHKGMKIAVVGRLQTGSYEKDGVRRYTMEVIVQSHEFLEPKRAGTPAPAADQTDVEEYSELPDEAEEQLPF